MNQPSEYRYPRQPIVVASELGDFDEVRRLAAAGVDLSEPDANEQTALYVAGRSNNLKMVELLLQLGAEPTIWPGVYTAPITRTNKPDSEIGKLLARYGYKADDSEKCWR